MSDEVAGGAVEQTAPKPKDAIRINIKRAERVIDLDMDKLTWKDTKELRKHRAAIANGTMDEDQLVVLMEGIIEKVTGLQLDDMPSEAVNRITQALFVGDTEAGAAEKN